MSTYKVVYLASTLADLVGQRADVVVVAGCALQWSDLVLVNGCGSFLCGEGVRGVMVHSVTVAIF